MNRLRLYVLLIALVPALLPAAGCAKPFPRQTLDRVNRNISFAELQKNPEQYKGEWLMLAGVVIDSKNTKEGTLIEVLQKPADSDGRPLQTDESGGRFLALAEKFLDTAVYHRGRQITVIGEVIGKKEMQIDEILYPYPYLAVKDAHLWDPKAGPRFFFGVGVQHRF